MQDTNSIEVYFPKVPKPLLIDIEDYHVLSEVSNKTKRWSYQAGYNRLCYSLTTRRRARLFYLHRMILKAPSDASVDHINGNGMDNRRSNLRLCTTQQNAFNTKKRSGSSKYKGVYRHQCGKFIANIKLNGKSKALGSFNSELEAAQAYDKAALKLQGDFAVLNFKKESK